MEEAVGSNVSRRSCILDEGHSPMRKESRYEFPEEPNSDESPCATGNIMQKYDFDDIISTDENSSGRTYLMQSDFDDKICIR